MLRTLAAYVDLIDVHSYADADAASAHALLALYNTTHAASGGKPLLHGEFSFTSVDSGVPNFKGAQARICITIEVLTLQESILRPAGRRRDAPNENPHLDMPVRPGLFDGLGINFNFFNPFGMFRKYFVRCCICLVIVAVVAVVLFFATS